MDLRIVKPHTVINEPYSRLLSWNSKVKCYFTAYIRPLKEAVLRRYFISYDEEADVLYLNFKKPSHADDSELLDNDVIVRYEEDEIVGLTVMNASKKSKVK